MKRYSLTFYGHLSILMLIILILIDIFNDILFLFVCLSPSIHVSDIVGQYIRSQQLSG